MNEKLALSDDILLSVDKPERYIGSEINSVVKNKEDVKLRFGVYNLFDKKVTPEDGFAYVLDGRRYSVSASFQF